MTYLLITFTHITATIIPDNESRKILAKIYKQSTSARSHLASEILEREYEMAASKFIIIAETNYHFMKTPARARSDEGRAIPYHEAEMGERDVIHHAWRHCDGEMTRFRYQASMQKSIGDENQCEVKYAKLMMR